MPDANDLNTLKMDTKTTLKASDIRIHNFNVDTAPRSRASADILERFQRAASQAAQPANLGGIAVSAVDVDFDSLQVDFGDHGPETKLLRDARRLIAERKFAPALPVLDEVLTVAQGHHEGTYLKAFCEQQLERSRQASKTLLSLNGAAVSNRLQTKIRVLREEIRANLLPRATKIFASVTKSREVGNAVAELREFAENDPGLGRYHYFVAGVLIVEKKWTDARRVLEEGIRVCESGQQDLEQLLTDLDQRLIPQLLSPARDYYRKRQPKAALQALDKLPAAVRESPLWLTFHEFLSGSSSGSGGLFSRLLSGGLKSSAAVHATPQRRDLYEFLVEPEMKAARAAFEKQDYATAQRALTSAVEIVPDFSLANFLLATSVYRCVAEKVQQRIGADLDETGARELKASADVLDSVRKNAEIGSRDPSVSDARRLVESIDEMSRQIATVVKKYEDQVHDAAIVNMLIDQFVGVLVQIMMFNANAPGLVASGQVFKLRQIAEQLWNQLSSTRSNLTSLRSKCRGDKAREIIDLVKNNFVEPNYQALRKSMGR